MKRKMMICFFIASIILTLMPTLISGFKVKNLRAALRYEEKEKQKYFSYIREGLGSSSNRYNFLKDIEKIEKLQKEQWKQMPQLKEELKNNALKNLFNFPLIIFCIVILRVSKKENERKERKIEKIKRENSRMESEINELIDLF